MKDWNILQLFCLHFVKIKCFILIKTVFGIYCWFLLGFNIMKNLNSFMQHFVKTSCWRDKRANRKQHIFIRIFKITLFSIENRYLELARYPGKTNCVYRTANSIFVKFSQQRQFCSKKNLTSRCGGLSIIWSLQVSSECLSEEWQQQKSKLLTWDRNQKILRLPYAKNWIKVSPWSFCLNNEGWQHKYFPVFTDKWVTHQEKKYIKKTAEDS